MSSVDIQPVGLKPVSLSPSGPVMPVRTAWSSGWPVSFSTSCASTISPTLEYRNIVPGTAPSTRGVASTAARRAASLPRPDTLAPTRRPLVWASSIDTVIAGRPNAGR
jgi:hypothetical protein